jgi:hypothetical protein
MLAVLTHIFDLESWSMEFTLIRMLEFRSACHICFILRVRVFARGLARVTIHILGWTVGLET